MKKKVIHKAKWQVLEGFFISPITVGAHTVCNNLSGLRMSPLWHKVSCKNCLKMKIK